MLVLVLSSIRAFPVYGKLDFFLLDGRPWWKPWRSMIEETLIQGKQPILSDIITSSVLRAVFAQEAVAFRFDRKYAQVDVEAYSILNAKQKNIPPMGGILLLLGNGPDAKSGEAGQPSSRGKSVMELMMELAKATLAPVEIAEQQHPYRCLINLQGFKPSWVSKETGHWPWKWAYPSELYEYRGLRGEDMNRLLRQEPPENCMVYF